MNQDMLWYVYAYFFLQQGILPYSGGWLEQPMHYIEAMSFIKSELNTQER